MSDPTSPPILDLDAFAARRTIRIDGALHEMLAPGELTLLETHSLATKTSRIDAMIKTPDLSEDDKAVLQRLLHDASNLILRPVSEDVRAKLHDGQRRVVIEVFTLLLQKMRLDTAAAIVTATDKTGENSSPGSSASTAENRTGGSEAHPLP